MVLPPWYGSLYDGGYIIFLLPGTGRSGGSADEAAGAEGRKAGASGADSLYLETAEFFMEILSAESDAVQETVFHDHIWNQRMHGADDRGIRH